MSVEAIAPVRNLSARAIRARLMNPPGGRDSSELEIVPEYLARAAKVDAEERRKGVLRTARRQHAKDLLTAFSGKLEKWVHDAGDIPTEPTIPRLTVSQIIDAASDYFDVPVIHIMSSRRKAIFVRPRRFVMYLARELTECSLPMIGARLGGRDHTTCCVGSEHIAALLRDGDQRTITDVAAMRAILGVE